MLYGPRRVIGTIEQEILELALMEFRKHFLPQRWKLLELIGEPIQLLRFNGV
jgi:hypothetical protein